jgi:hypothetical protein
MTRKPAARLTLHGRGAVPMSSPPPLGNRNWRPCKPRIPSASGHGPVTSQMSGKSWGHTRDTVNQGKEFMSTMMYAHSRGGKRSRFSVQGPSDARSDDRIKFVSLTCWDSTCPKLKNTRGKTQELGIFSNKTIPNSTILLTCMVFLRVGTPRHLVDLHYRSPLLLLRRKTDGRPSPRLLGRIDFPRVSH